MKSNKSERISIFASKGKKSDSQGESSTMDISLSSESYIKSLQQTLEPFFNSNRANSSAQFIPFVISRSNSEMILSNSIKFQYIRNPSQDYMRKLRLLRERRETKETECEYSNFVLESFEALRKIREFPVSSISKQVNLPRGKGKKKTLIFDLDETLVHCSGRGTVQISLGKNKKTKISIRPYAKECLAKASKLFEVIVFTSSSRQYANAVIDYLDPTRQLVHHRVYRKSCTNSQGFYVKDLRVIGRKLKNVAIVDNSIISFSYQLNNGVPVLPWKGNKADVELHNLIGFMDALAQAKDVRELNRNVFKLEAIFEEFLKNPLIR